MPISDSLTAFAASLSIVDTIVNIIAAGATFAIALASYLQIKTSKDQGTQLRTSVELLNRSIRDQLRPVIVPYPRTLDPDTKVPTYILRNEGSGPAIDIRSTIKIPDPAVTSPDAAVTSDPFRLAGLAAGESTPEPLLPIFSNTPPPKYPSWIEFYITYKSVFQEHVSTSAYFRNGRLEQLSVQPADSTT